MSDSETKDPASENSLEKFDRLSSIGDILFFYKTWQAYNILPQSNTIIPGRRVFIGSLDGDIVFERTVMLSGIVDLAECLISTIRSDFQLIQDLKNYQVSSPFSRDDYIEKLRSIVDDIGIIQKIASDNEIVFSDSIEKENLMDDSSDQ